MNYSVFCNAFIMRLSSRLEPGIKLCREKIPKNNGILLDSIILTPASGACAPVIYLEPLYAHYKNGASMDSICRAVLSCLEHQLPFSAELCFKLHKLDAVKDRITFRLVNRKQNEKLLEDVPWLPFLDLAVIFYLHLESNSEGQVSALIHNRLASLWALSPKELFSFAQINTPSLLPPVLTKLDDMVCRLAPGFFPKPEESSSLPLLHILTNRSGLFGAACMLYEDAVKDFAGRMASDIIILPCSVHEVLLLPDFHAFEYDALCRMVQDVNASEIPEEDILSDHIYIYARCSSSFMAYPRPSSCHTP